MYFTIYQDTTLIIQYWPVMYQSWPVNVKLLTLYDTVLISKCWLSTFKHQLSICEDTIWPAMCQMFYEHQVTTLKTQYGQSCAKVRSNKQNYYMEQIKGVVMVPQVQVKRSRVGCIEDTSVGQCMCQTVPLNILLGLNCAPIWPAMCQSVYKHQVTTLKVQYGQSCANVSLNIKLLHWRYNMASHVPMCTFKHQVTTLKIQYGQSCANVYLNIKLLHWRYNMASHVPKVSLNIKLLHWRYNMASHVPILNIKLLHWRYNMASHVPMCL